VVLPLGKTLQMSATMMDQALMSQLPSQLQFVFDNPIIFALITVWVLVWKGLALWKAARLSHKWWFMIILVANTLGILEIIYLFVIARKYSVEEKVEDAEEKSMQK
jgi:hypothetical protein